MIKISKQDLKNLIAACDLNNPKYELNYVYVDSENIVSCNTRVLAMFKHNEYVPKPFFIHISILKEAVKNTKCEYYSLDDFNKVSALDKKTQFEDKPLILMSYSIETDKYFKDSFKYPDYKRIIPEKTNIKKPFTNKEQIAGIAALENVSINPKFIPNFESGIVGINSRKLPVKITNEYNNKHFIIMPIIDDRFKELQDIIDKEGR